MIPNVRKDTLLPIIRQRIVPDSIVYTESYPAYDVLDVYEFHHHRIDHSDAYARERHNHINGIENFWSQAKCTLSRYNGTSKAHFPPLSSKRPNSASTTEPQATNCAASNAGPKSAHINASGTVPRNNISGCLPRGVREREREVFDP
jgi:transposase-like protein